MNLTPLNLTITIPHSRVKSPLFLTELVKGIKALKVAAIDKPRGMKIGFQTVTVIVAAEFSGDAHAVCMVDVGSDRGRLKALRDAVDRELALRLIVAPLTSIWYVSSNDM